MTGAELTVDCGQTVGTVLPPSRRPPPVEA